ncbi:hypothetical protein HMPREF0379_0497 [[Eubacterium] yurii subsp. margaretiae ATCC 43715]|nr:hypothetical protein HMPREF0379_0497 [[Eubacterium] yurii subsp. margaretiae ATCC 43715]
MKKQTSETIELGIFLALAGGFMDAYSYICRGGVFANAQTGNILLFGVHITQGNFDASVKHFTPVLFFSAGIIIAEIIKSKLKKKIKYHWRQIVLLLEIAIFFLVSQIPLDHNLLANNLTSMACGMQVESFRTMYGNGIATTMCIGNLRSANENIFKFFESGQIISLKKALLYFFVILCFATGAILGNICVKLIGTNSIMICNIFLFIGIILMFEEHRNTLLEL